MPIVVLVKNAGRVISVLIGIFLLATGALILTPLGFPYSGDPSSPAPERFMIVVLYISCRLIDFVFINFIKLFQFSAHPEAVL